jgi:hypothetical protein
MGPFHALSLYAWTRNNQKSQLHGVYLTLFFKNNTAALPHTDSHAHSKEKEKRGNTPEEFKKKKMVLFLLLFFLLVSLICSPLIAVRHFRFLKL